jgi:hypothetical protein
METETIETATEQDTEYQPVRRDVTLRFYRHPKVKFAEFHAALRSDEIEIERNGVKRTYNNPNNARYNRIAKIVREHRIPMQVDLHTYTEVTFQADKE